MKAVTGAMGANSSTTGTQKDADAATKAWAAANPDATPKDIADYKANLIAGGMGGNDLETRQYLDEKRNGLTTDDLCDLEGQEGGRGGRSRDRGEERQRIQGQCDVKTIPPSIPS